MKNFVKLVRFEFNRFAPIYATLAVLTALTQLIGVFVTTNGYLRSVSEQKQSGIVNDSEIIANIGKMGMTDFVNNLWFLGPIMLCGAVLMLYSVFIWYRDWLGKNTFIYRLLMLPTQRLNILFSKVTTIFLMVIGLVALQLVLLYIENNLFQMLLPTAYFNYANLNQMIQSSYYLTMFYPTSGLVFISRYSKGLLGLLVVSTVILFERSYKIKGLIIGVAYATVVQLVFYAVYFMQFYNVMLYLFASEIFLISLVLTVVAGALSIWISHRLLNKKVTV
ncbi:hypothetical protein [Desemzia incerta]|uniref:hypothetical protein n=1 Tax=Desemzia incerta TaxID=82801 RepID=UPI003315622F